MLVPVLMHAPGSPDPLPGPLMHSTAAARSLDSLTSSSSEPTAALMVNVTPTLRLDLHDVAALAVEVTLTTPITPSRAIDGVMVLGEKLR